VLQGQCAVLAKDGSYLIEGFFKNGESEGLKRTIKMSLRKPGHFTIREGLFADDLEVDMIR